jgi:hypothetical protein
MSDTETIGITRVGDTEIADLVCDRCDQGWRVYIKPPHKKQSPTYKLKIGVVADWEVCPDLIKTIMRLNTHIRCNACGGGLLHIPSASRFDKDNLLKLLETAKGFANE